MDMRIQIIILLCTCVLLVNSCIKSRSIRPIRRYGTYGTRYTHPINSKWDTHIEARTDFNGRHGVGAGVVYKFRKREAQSNENKYNVTINIDPCFFVSYDLNRNGEFAKDELLTIFGNDGKANILFADLDMEPGDGVVTEEEFYTKAPFIIADCFNKDS